MLRLGMVENLLAEPNIFSALEDHFSKFIENGSYSSWGI